MHRPGWAVAAPGSETAVCRAGEFGCQGDVDAKVMTIETTNSIVETNCRINQSAKFTV